MSQLETNTTTIDELITMANNLPDAGSGGGGGSLITGTMSVADMGMYDPATREYLLTPSVPFDVSAVNGIVVTGVGETLGEPEIYLMLFRQSVDQNFTLSRGYTNAVSGSTIIVLGTQLFSVSDDGSITVYGIIGTEIAMSFIAF